MNTRLSEENCLPLKRVVETCLKDIGIKTPIVNLEVVDPDKWYVSICVPYRQDGKKLGVSRIGKVRTYLTKAAHVDDDLMDVFMRNEKGDSYEWYFVHPDAPEELVSDAKMRVEEAQENEANSEEGMGIPVPDPKRKNNGCAFLVLKEEFFREIESGRKVYEYRNLNSYYCDKFFGGKKMVEKVRFQLGYGNGSGKPEQMTFRVKQIDLANERDQNEVFPAILENGKMTTYKDLPSGFVPVAYVIELGERID